MISRWKVVSTVFWINVAMWLAMALCAVANESVMVWRLKADVVALVDAQVRASLATVAQETAQRVEAALAAQPALPVAPPVSWTCTRRWPWQDWHCVREGTP